MTQHCRRQILRRRDRGAPIPPTSGHSAAESSEDSASCPRIFERGRFHVEANRQHAATYVATDSLRIDQPRCRDNHADADICSKMHVWHDDYLLDVRRASEALDRLRHVVVHGLGQRGADWSE
jgi:hypothetical protein